MSAWSVSAIRERETSTCASEALTGADQDVLRGPTSLITRNSRTNRRVRGIHGSTAVPGTHYLETRDPTQVIMSGTDGDHCAVGNVSFAACPGESGYQVGHCHNGVDGNGPTAKRCQDKSFTNGYATKAVAHRNAMDFVQQNDGVLTLSTRHWVAPASHAGELHWNLNDSGNLKDLHPAGGQLAGHVVPKAHRPSWLSRGRSCQPRGGPENSSYSESLLLGPPVLCCVVCKSSFTAQNSLASKCLFVSLCQTWMSQSLLT